MRIKYRLKLHPFLTLDPLHIAKQYPAFCVGIPTLCTKTYDSPHIIRTLADSESVALVRSAISYYEGIVKSNKSEESKKKNNVLIFPEGRLPKKDEKELLAFKPSFIYIALESNAPIIPIYTNGKYGFSGNTRLIIGEKIYVSDLMDDSKTIDENIENICQYFRNYIMNLRDELNEKEKTNKKNK